MTGHSLTSMVAFMHKKEVLVRFDDDDWEEIRQLPGFVDIWKYKSKRENHPTEFGYIELGTCIVKFLYSKHEAGGSSVREN